MKAPSTITAHLFQVVALAAIVMLTNLGGPRLWDDDEPRNSGCAREMFLRNDWIVPTFNAELRTHKPILLYWCMLVSYHIGGANEFTARLPSALAAIGTVVLTYAMGRRLFNPRAGFWAATALACSVSFAMVSRAATPDGVLIFTSTLAVALFVFGTFARRKSVTGDVLDADQPAPLQRAAGHWFPQRPTLVLMMYAAMGLAVLAKGPVGLVLPTAVIGMFLLIQRLPALQTDLDSNDSSGELRQMVLPAWLHNAARPLNPLHFLGTCWYMWPLAAIVTVVLIAGPWYAAVGVQTDGEWLRGFFFEHNVERALSAKENHHGFIGFYPVMLIAGFFPFSIFALPVIIETTRRLMGKDAWQPGYLLAVCWIGVYLCLFSVARTKLLNYILPCFPAAALLVGAFLDRWLAGKLLIARWWPAVSFAVLMLIGGFLAVGVYAVANEFLPGDEFLALIGLLPAVAGLIALGRQMFNFDRRWTAGIMATCFAAMTTLIFAVGAQRVDAHREDQKIVSAILAREANPKLATFHILEPSWVYYGKQSITELPKPEKRIKTSNVPVVMAKMFDNKQALTFLSKDPTAYLITTRTQYEKLQPHLPADLKIITEQPLFESQFKMDLSKLFSGNFKKAPQQLVVIGREKANVIANTPAVETKR
ncbi:ArnT family glycosyltransferase [Anatilimnocola floriformis]|uniref:ArnT family glycosyltransferase n=1 Tax=Anatilimnocola floriformis TaxID=2948575 RepID=UPI0020C474EC|nr:glycosyltransferase family 39 protein [Anatilimnocola floriformis]